MEKPSATPRAKMRAQLREMQPAETLSFPIEKLLNVRTAASELGAMMKRKYRTITDRPNDVVWVTRVS